MRVLFDIVHPAHVHFFKHMIWELEKRGHQTRIGRRTCSSSADETALPSCRHRLAIIADSTVASVRMTMATMERPKNSSWSSAYLGFTRMISIASDNTLTQKTAKARVMPLIQPGARRPHTTEMIMHHPAQTVTLPPNAMIGSRVR